MKYSHKCNNLPSLYKDLPALIMPCTRHKGGQVPHQALYCQLKVTMKKKFDKQFTHDKYMSKSWLVYVELELFVKTHEYNNALDTSNN